MASIEPSNLCGLTSFISPFFPLFKFSVILAYSSPHLLSALPCSPTTGIGYTMVMIAFYVDLYYNLLIAWALHFFFASFSINSLPWTRCDGEWNTGECNSVLKFNTVTDGNGTSAADEYFK